MGRTAMEAALRIDMRRRRADSLAAAIIRELREPLDTAQRALDAVDHPDAHRFYREVHERLLGVLIQEGVEVLSDYDRQEMGLPPRGDDGWTLEEVAALERRRLEILMRPMPPFIMPSTQKDAAAPHKKDGG